MSGDFDSDLSINDALFLVTASKPAADGPTKIFVRFIPTDIKEDQLMTVFQVFGINSFRYFVPA